jgi:hypothetical protein
MKRRIVIAAVAATTSMLVAVSLLSTTSVAATTSPAAQAHPIVATVSSSSAATVAVSTAIPAQPAPARAPDHAAPTVPATTTGAVSHPATATAAAPAATAAARAAYINAMYLSVVPAGQRAAVAGHYVLGYNLPGLSCGTGCTGLFNGQARSSFNNTFFAETLPYQRNTIAHEAAHAYGFLYIDSYATPNWTATGGWQGQFHTLDRSFVRTYDAEAWAACVAWKESGFNNRVDQITAVCTPQAAAAAIAHLG